PSTEDPPAPPEVAPWPSTASAPCPPWPPRPSPCAPPPLPASCDAAEESFHDAASAPLPPSPLGCASPSSATHALPPDHPAPTVEPSAPLGCSGVPSGARGGGSARTTLENPSVTAKTTATATMR